MQIRWHKGAGTKIFSLSLLTESWAFASRVDKQGNFQKNGGILLRIIKYSVKNFFLTGFKNGL